jgi:hypothetical protein
MSQVIRMDQSGHTIVAEWSADDPATVEVAAKAFRAELEQGYFAVVSRGEGAGGAGLRAAGRRTAGDPAQADRRRLGGNRAGTVRVGRPAPLPELARVYWRPRSER